MSLFKKIDNEHVFFDKRKSNNKKLSYTQELTVLTVLLHDIIKQNALKKNLSRKENTENVLYIIDKLIEEKKLVGNSFNYVNEIKTYIYNFYKSDNVFDKLVKIYDLNEDLKMKNILDYINDLSNVYNDFNKYKFKN